MRRLCARVGTSLVFLASLSGCYRSHGGEGPLVEVDPSSLPVHASSTWIRAEGAGATAVTELLLIEDESPATLGSARRRIVRARVGQAGDVEVAVGALDAFPTPGTGQVAFVWRHVYTPQPGVPILDRLGAYGEDLAPVAPDALRMEASGDELRITINGDTRAYASLPRLIEVLSGAPGFDTQDGAQVAAQLVALSLYTAQARVPGYESFPSGEVVWTSLPVAPLVRAEPVDGSLRVEFRDPITMPTWAFDFDAFEDQGGISLTGTREMVVAFSGDGSMVGVLGFTLDAGAGSGAEPITGSIDFAGVEVVEGYPEGGAATVTIDGSAFAVATDVLFHPDLSAYLPAP